MKKQLIFLISLCILFTGGYLIKFYFDSRQWKQMCSETAKETFREAILMEVSKKKENKVYDELHTIVSTNPITNTTVCDSITISTTEFGKQKYQINKEKLPYQLINNSFDNSLLSYLLHKQPLSVDTIKNHWDRLLLRRGLKIHTIVRYALTDLLGQTDTLYSPQGASIARFDSISFWCLGYRLESEFTGFASYIPYWKHQPSIFLFWILIPWSVLIIYLLYKRRFSTLETIDTSNIRLKKPSIYLLGDNIKFNTSDRTLCSENQSCKLSPQSVVLLTFFLHSPEYRLSTEEISRKMWHGKASKEQIYSAIRRLRKEFAKFSNQQSIECLNGVYQLKLPISSKK